MEFDDFKFYFKFYFKLFLIVVFFTVTNHFILILIKYILEGLFNGVKFLV